MKKTQSSLEFLTIMGIGFTIILILGGLFVSFTNESKKGLDRDQLNKIFSEVLVNVEQMYFRGPGNRVRYTASFPEGIQNISIHQSTGPEGDYSYMNITFIQENNIINELFFPSELYVLFNCSYSCFHGSNYAYYNNSAYITPGPKNLVIESRGDWVTIDFIT